MEEPEIIEVEAVDKSIHEARPNAKPRKAKYQYGRRIAAFSRLDAFCLRSFFLLFLLGCAGTWAFGICFSQHQSNIVFLVFLILSVAVLAFSVLAFASHFLWKALIRGWKKKDPNFEG